jgi:O-antigen ligase
VANGVSLNLLGLLALHAYRRGRARGVKIVVLLASVPIAILATMTRAVWLSFAGTVVALIFLSKNRTLRRAGVGLALVVGAGLAVVLSSPSLERTLSDRLTDSGPVEFRQLVYAGGWQMFLERPLTGWGFHQMPAELPRYVGDGPDKVLYPHNTYLEVLVEGGVAGLALYLWLMWELLRLGRGAIPARERKGFLDQEFHRLWPILLAVYWVNAAVVVMNYYFVNCLLFTIAGMLAAQGRRAEAG